MTNGRVKYTLYTSHGTNFLTGVNPAWWVEELLVLVIEDDLAIQALIDEVLCDGGYEPANARTGEEAITLLRGRQIKYRVLITTQSRASRC